LGFILVSASCTAGFVHASGAGCPESLNLGAGSKQIKFSERIFAAAGKIRDSLRRLLQWVYGLDLRSSFPAMIADARTEKDVERGIIQHMAGTGKKGFTGNGGPAKEATLNGPKGLAVAPNGNVYLADTENHAIRMIDVRKGTLELVAGTGQRGALAETEPLKTPLARPHGIFADTDGSIFIGDTEGYRILVLPMK
jgi:DNA-binding beta-propeller fold protein YncE